MENIGKISQWVFTIGDMRVVLNSDTLIMTWVVMGIILLFTWAATRQMALEPGNWQQLAELMVDWFRELVVDALGEEYTKHYFPLICGLFIFLFLCNSIGAVPGLSEPTKDLNTTLGLGIMGAIIAHGTAIKKKGLVQYLKEYFQPVFFMMPLNVIGELAKVVSISFRLFGNIMGGSIIILVVSYLLWGLVLPPFLYFFFSFFVGAVQAFVFTMLTLVYISVLVR